MAQFFTKRLSPKAKNLVEAVGEGIDSAVPSDEERTDLEHEMTKAETEYEVEMATLGLKETQAYLGDVASARESQIRMQESEHASMLAKNVHPFLAVMIVGLTFVMYWVVIFAGPFESGMKDIVIYILGALTTVSTQVAAYYFGSSQGSADKNKMLTSLRQKGG